MDAKAYVKEVEAREEEGTLGDVVYLAGPIDHKDPLDDPDSRHGMLNAFINESVTIYCPVCMQRVKRSSPIMAVARNMSALTQADYMIAVWDGPEEEVSFGTPVELFAAGSLIPDRTVVIGTMGPGMIASALRDRGVREVGTYEEAVDLLWP